jgi:hypothetical protein
MHCLSVCMCATDLTDEHNVELERALERLGGQLQRQRVEADRARQLGLCVRTHARTHARTHISDGN